MANYKEILSKHKSTILYGFSLAVLMFLLRWLELRYFYFNHSYEIYIGAIAVIFTGLGIWLALSISKPKVETIVVEKQVFITKPDEFVFNKTVADQLELSKKELEVLSLIAAGHSNEEIARQLFISLSTVKTHNQNLFFKLDVKRRTQAVEKAKKLSLIP